MSGRTIRLAEPPSDRSASPFARGHSSPPAPRSRTRSPLHKSPPIRCARPEQQTLHHPSHASRQAASRTCRKLTETRTLLIASVSAPPPSAILSGVMKKEPISCKAGRSRPSWKIHRYPHKPIRIAIPERFQQHRPDRAEHRRIAADPQRQCDHGRRAESRRFQKQPPRKPDVLHPLLNEPEHISYRTAA